MKNKLLLLVVVLFCVTSFAQETFKKAVLVNNQNETIQCLVNYENWINSPTQIQYKLSETGSTQVENVQNIKMLDIKNVAKYEKHLVAIDKSSVEVNEVSNSKLPNLVSEELLLKVLVESNVSLYEYTKNKSSLYVVKKDNGDFEQLIYKKYKTSTGVVSENNEYKQQLWNLFQSNKTVISKANYNSSDIKNIVLEYNKSQNNAVVDFDMLSREKGNFSLYLRGGLNINQIDLNNKATEYYSIDFGSAIGGRFGVELEYKFGSKNKNKWAITLEPNYQFYSVKEEVRLYQDPDDVRDDTEIASIDHSTIEAPLGVRYYINLNEKSNIFLDASFVLMLNTSSVLEYTQSVDKAHNKSSNNFELGAGYSYNNKINFQLKYKHGTNEYKNDNQSNSVYEADNNTIAFVVGFAIL